MDKRSGNDHKSSILSPFEQYILNTKDYKPFKNKGNTLQFQQKKLNRRFQPQKRQVEAFGI